MKKILAFAGSNHSNSINYQLVTHTASLFSEAEITLLDIRAWDIPVYSIDMDPDQTPDEIQELMSLIQEHDGFVLSSPEHNGNISAFLKNIIDWMSRRTKKVFGGKPMLLMSTSQGKKGGVNQRILLEKMLPFQGADIVAKFSLPAFSQNMVKGEVQGEWSEMLKKAVAVLEQAV